MGKRAGDAGAAAGATIGLSGTGTAVVGGAVGAVALGVVGVPAAGVAALGAVVYTGEAREVAASLESQVGSTRFVDSMS